VLGFAQYFIDVSNIEVELRAVDRNILTYAGGAFLLGSVLSGSILLWAFRKLRKVNKLLAQRTEHLISANHKLGIEARTAAIGAITSHLIHGLKSPLQGIRQFVSARPQNTGSDPDDSIWQDAAETTERMQKLINEVIDVLKDRSGEFNYELSVAEVESLVEERLSDYTLKNEVRLVVEGPADLDEISLSNDRANLIILILVNLIRNAIDASKKNEIVWLKIMRSESEILTFEVVDGGLGLPERVLENLFQPVISSKQNGSGIGLSLCRELARHLDGKLELVKTGPDGTTFRLNVSNVT